MIDFSNCNDLKTLMTERIAAIREGTASIVEINSAFNKRRSEICATSSRDYKVVPTERIVVPQQKEVSAIPVVFKNTPGIITFENNTFII